MKRSITYYLERCFIFAFFIITFGTFGIISYWEFLDNTMPMKIIYQHPYPHDGSGWSRETLVDKKKFAFGEHIFIWIEFCNLDDVKGSVYVSVINTIVYNYPINPFFKDVKGCTKRSFSRIVPNLPPGKYKYRVKLEFKLNPIKYITLKRKDISFEIMSKEKNDG